MSSHLAKETPITNQLLAALPADQLQHILPKLENVALAFGQVIFEPTETIHHVYFPTNAMISLLSVTEDAETLEIAMVGKEGVVGLPVILEASSAPYRAMVQVAGQAFRIKASALSHEFNRSRPLQVLLLGYVNTLLQQIALSAICNHFHSVPTRLCRWLLRCQDGTQSKDFLFTQEFLSSMLGVRRSSISSAARLLERAGLIRYSRGHVRLLDRKGLESLACECYRSMRPRK